MVDSQFGHSMIVVDDYLMEAEALKASWHRMEPVLFDMPKYEVDTLYERLDRATAKKFINPKCQDAKQDLLVIWNLLKAKLQMAPITTLPSGEIVTQAMYDAGYLTVQVAMTDSEFSNQVKNAEIGDIYHEPTNLFSTLFDTIGIADTNHPVYFYVRTWVKVHPGVWSLVNLQHVSSFSE